jgi:hypothetical protein
MISFVEGENDVIKIIGSNYEDSGEKLGGSELGDSYHIVLFRDSKTDSEKYDDFETFDAILGDPLEYISGLLPKSIYGIVAKRTTTSGTFINKILDNIREMEYTVTVFSK